MTRRNATSRLADYVADKAADSPLQYSELAELNQRRELAAALDAMTASQRIGAAAVIAESTGRELSDVLNRFGRLIADYQSAQVTEVAEAYPDSEAAWVEAAHAAQREMWRRRFVNTKGAA